MKVDIGAIKTLREQTGAGVADCRQALEEAKGDMKKAAEWIAKKGMERASKKSEREVKAGQVFAYVHHTGRVATLVSLACETDFVAKNEEFAKLGKELAMQVASARPENVEALLAGEYIRDAGMTVEQLIKQAIAKIGENIQVVEFKIAEV